MNLLSTKRNKLIAAVLISIAFVALISFAAYSIVNLVLPKKEIDRNSTSVDGSSTAKKAIDEGLVAETKNNYDEATKLYEQSLSYYKNKSEKSASDNNAIANIESRLRAIQQQKDMVKKIKNGEISVPVSQPPN